MTAHQHSTAADRRLSVLQLVFSIVAAGAASALVVLAFSPFSAATAAFSAPLYGVIAGGYSVFPFLARRLLGYRWAATVVGCLAGVLSAPISPIGLLIVVPFVGAGAAYDSVVWAITSLRRGARDSEWVFVLAAVVSALVLFLVSLPVLSPSNRGLPVFLLAVFGGRLVGQLAASALAGIIARVLRRFGAWRWS
jgi:hypothetical protein